MNKRPARLQNEERACSAGPLFDHPAARSTDPLTSHLASAHITDAGIRGKQAAEALALVRAHPDETSLELSRYGLDRYVLARRLADLRSIGKVTNGDARRCAVSGRQALTWRTA